MKNKFLNAQEMAKLHPATFEAPTTEDLEKVKVGDYVKVSTGDERFWVEVTKVDGSKISGEINNDLVCTDNHGLKCGDKIEFNKECIYQTYE